MQDTTQGQAPELRDDSAAQPRRRRTRSPNPETRANESAAPAPTAQDAQPQPRQRTKRPATSGRLSAVLSHPAVSIAGCAIAGAVLLAALGAAGASAYHLAAVHMQMAILPAIANAVVIALGPLVLAVGAVQAKRERTRAALAIWFTAWAVVALGVAAADGVLSAGAIVANVEALTMTGKIAAPLLGALAVVTAGSVSLTLRGDDNPHAVGALLAMIAKACLIGFSSFGILNLAANAPNMRAQAFAVFVAVVVEAMFIALLAKGKRGTLANALTWVLGAVIALNATETVAVGFGFTLPDALAWVPMAGSMSIVLSGAIVTAAAIAVTLASGAPAERSGTPFTFRVADRLQGLAQLRANVAAAFAPAALPRPAVIELAKDGAPAPELAGTDDDAARAEVAPRQSKRGRK